MENIYDIALESQMEEILDLDQFDDTDEDFDAALEGMNMDAAKYIRADDVKEARRLVKEAKKLKKLDPDKAVKNLDKAQALITKMKTTVDRLPEPTGFKEKLFSHLTPVFSLMPASEIVDFMILPDGQGGFYYSYTMRTYSDHASSSTSSGVKQNIQERFNLFIHNLEVTRRSYAEYSKRIKNPKTKEHKKYQKALDKEKAKAAKESDVNVSDIFSIATDGYEPDEVPAEDPVDEPTVEDVLTENGDEDVDSALESVLVTAMESSLTKAEREKIPDELFGLPSTRKYPLDTKDRIFQAIKFFYYCKEPDRKELATNIVKRMKELKIPVTFDDKSIIKKYL